MRISWVTSGAVEFRNGVRYSPLGSTRYRCLIPAKELESQGHLVSIISADALKDLNALSKYDIGDAVIFSKSFNQNNEQFAAHVRDLHKLVICDFCDFDFSTPGPLRDHLKNMSTLAHRLVAGSDALADIVAETLNTVRPTVVSDPYEGQAGVPAFSPMAGRLRLAWYGHAYNLQDLFDVLSPLAELGNEFQQDLRVVCELIPEFQEAFTAANKNFGDCLVLEFMEWSVEAVMRALAECDLAIIPSTNTGKKRAKTSNRVVEALRAGRLAVANKVPAYLAFADFIRLDTNIAEGVRWAATHPTEVKARIIEGQKYVAAKHSPTAIAGKWAEILGILN